MDKMHFTRMDQGSDEDFQILKRVHEKNLNLLGGNRFFPVPAGTKRTCPSTARHLSRRNAHTVTPDEMWCGIRSERREIQTRMTAKSCSRSTGFVT